MGWSSWGEGEIEERPKSDLIKVMVLSEPGLVVISVGRVSAVRVSCSVVFYWC